MALTRVKIFTNTEKKNTEQAENYEVEQKLIISANGQVSFTSNYYGGGYNKYKKGRKEELNIDPETAQEILDAIDEVFAQESFYNVLPGFGLWNVTTTDDKRSMKDYYGAISGVHNQLTQFISHRIPIDHLVLFG